MSNLTFKIFFILVCILVVSMAALGCSSDPATDLTTDDDTGTGTGVVDDTETEDTETGDTGSESESESATESVTESVSDTGTGTGTEPPDTSSYVEFSTDLIEQIAHGGCLETYRIANSQEPFCLTADLDRARIAINSILASSLTAYAVGTLDEGYSPQVWLNPLDIILCTGTPNLPQTTFDAINPTYGATTVCRFPDIDGQCPILNAEFAQYVNVWHLKDVYDQELDTETGWECELDAIMSGLNPPPGFHVHSVDTDIDYWIWRVRARSQCVAADCDCDIILRFYTDSTGTVTAQETLVDLSTAQCDDLRFP